MFTIGKEYHRKRDIHDKYKGQSQGGISTPKDYPYIFIFTSDAGEQHGYHDEYHDGIFWYTGEGQVGDMTMDGGNRAILEHEQNNKTIHVFEYTRKAHVRYMGEAKCLGYHEERRPDREGSERNVFVFHLDIDSVPDGVGISEPKKYYGSTEVKTLKSKSIKELREIAISKSADKLSPKEKTEIAFVRSEALKRYVIARAKGKCEGCGANAPFETKLGPFLECHHLHRMADGGPDHPENVVALCPNCHRKAHYAIDAQQFNDFLKSIALKAEAAAL